MCYKTWSFLIGKFRKSDENCNAWFKQIINFGGWKKNVNLSLEGFWFLNTHILAICLKAKLRDLRLANPGTDGQGTILDGC